MIDWDCLMVLPCGFDLGVGHICPVLLLALAWPISEWSAIKADIPPQRRHVGLRPPEADISSPDGPRAQTTFASSTAM
jgi:hypothetical protein